MFFLCVYQKFVIKWSNRFYCKKKPNQFQGYDKSANTWEPEKNFESPKLLDDYHKSIRAASISKELTRIKDDSPNPAKQKPKKFLEADDLLTPTSIKERNLVPDKVLNIFHVRDNEKDLVAYIRFKNLKDAQFVDASWAHKNCPQLVIKFYESRIFWRDRMWVVWFSFKWFWCYFFNFEIKLSIRKDVILKINQKNGSFRFDCRSGELTKGRKTTGKIQSKKI